MPFWTKKKWRKKKLGLLIAIPIVSLAFLIVGIVRFEIVHPKSKHVAIVSSHSHGQEVYVGTESMGKTPTRLKLKGDAKISIQASSKHEAIEAREVKEILKNDVIFTNLPIEEKFESHQYREIVEDMKGNLERNGHLIIPEKRYLAYSYFWLGNLSEAKAILDELISEHLTDLPRSDQAEVFMYLGYSNLNLGDESEAREKFIDAFKRNIYLEHNHDALRNKELGERVVREAKIAAQMKVRLDLFVAVDISQSALKGQEARIVELQNGVVTKLNEIGQAFFYPFGKTLPAPEFPNYSSSPDAIIQVQDLSSFAQWTDFFELFDKLPQIIENRRQKIIKNRRQNQDSPEHQIAILIISDGEHSVEDDEGGDTIRIPLEVARKLEVFSEHHKDIPIVMVTIDQGIQANAVTSSSDADIGTKGLNYADKWGKELKKHPVGQSFYYGSKSTLDNILGNIFDVIAPYRDKVLVTHEPERKTESHSADNQEWYIVPVHIQTTLSEVTLKVGTSIAGKKDDDAPKINTIWEELKGKNREKSSLTISRQPPNDRIDRSERVLINRANLREAFKREAFKKANSNSSLWTPQIFTLNFYQGEGEVGTVSLPFSEDKPKIQIKPLFGKNVTLKAGKKKDLRFKAKIIPPSHHLEQPIPIKITVKENKIFREKIGEFKPSMKTEVIPKDTIRRPGRHEFNLSVTAFEIDHFWDREICDNIELSVKPHDNNPVYTIDDSKLGKINFRVVHEWVYLAHQCAQFIWVPLLAIVLLILHPSSENGKTTSINSSGPDEKPGFLSKEFEILEGLLEKCKGRKRAFYISSGVAFLLVNLSIWIYWPSPVLWILIFISLVLLGIPWKRLERLFIYFSVISLICAVAWIWGSISVINWDLISICILVILFIVLFVRRFVRDSYFDRSDIFKSIFLGAELWLSIQTILLGETFMGILQLIRATIRYFL